MNTTSISPNRVAAGVSLRLISLTPEKSAAASQWRLLGSRLQHAIPKVWICYALLLSVPAVDRVWAATRTWDGSANGYLSTPANWVGGVAPVNGDNLVFPASGVSRFFVTNNFIGGPRFPTITFEGTGFTLSGAYIVTSRVGAENVNGFNRVNCALQLSTNATFYINGDTGALFDINGDVALGPYTLNISAGGGDLYIGGVISGSGGLTKISGGTVRIDGTSANTYTGPTTVIGGTLELNKGPAAGAVAVPGDLLLGASGAMHSDVVRLLRNNQLSSSSDVTIGPAGLLDLNGSSTPIGALTLNGGDVDVVTSMGTLILNGDVTATPSSGTVEGQVRISGSLSLGAMRTFTVNDFVGLSPDMTMDAMISGPGGIIKSGAGWLSLNDINSYAGLTIVREGVLAVHGASTVLGSTSAGTVVSNGATLTFDISIGAEPLTVNGNGTEFLAALHSFSSISWAGPITLATDATIGVGGSLDLPGVISGPGALTKIGTGTLLFSGSASNTYAGATRVNEGTLLLQRTFFDRSIPGDLFIGDGVGGANSDVVRIENFAQINNLSAVTIASSGFLDQNGISEAIGSLAGTGRVQVGPNSLGVGANGASTTYAGEIIGTGGLTKMGLGALTLTGNNTYQGQTLVADGTLLVNGAQPRSPVNVSSGTLGGTGVVGNVTVSGSGNLAPGVSPGQLTCSNLSVAVLGDFFVELNGVIPGADYDQMNVRGGVTLNSSPLHVSVGFPSSGGQSFTLISNDATDAVTGTFSGLPEGATLNAGGQVFQITYQGGVGNNDVVLTRGASLISSGLRHTTLGNATLTPGPAGDLIVGNIGSSGDDGVFIPLGEAQGWQSQLTALDPGTGQGRLNWEIQGQRGNLPLQSITRGSMEVINGEIHAFGDSSAVGGTAHWVEVFAGDEFVKSALVPSNAPLFRLLAPFTNPLAMVLRCEGSFPGKPYWHCDISWSEPRRVAVPGTDDSPLEGATRVRIRPFPPQGLANAGPPFALQLTAKNISAIRISDEALLYPPTPTDEGLPHRALGQARFEPVPNDGHPIISNIGSSGLDGVSIDAGDRSSGIGILTAPISLTPNGTMLALEAMGTFDGMPDRSMGTASLRTVGTAVQAMADFTPVGSSMVRVEVFRGSSLVGSATAPAGLVATLASPIGQGGAPSLDAVGWVPPCLLPVIDGIAQSAFEPLPCYFFHFDGLALFTTQGGQQFVGDSLRLLTANDQPRAQSLARLDIRAALMAPDASLALTVEKLRLPAPQITRVFPLQVRSGEIVEILGRGFGSDPFDLRVVGSARIAGLDRLTVPFHVLSASDTRILARVGPVPPGTPGGPIQVYRGVGNEGTPQGVAPDVQFIQPIRAWREGTPSGSFTLGTVYQPPKFSAPPKECFQSGPPVQGVLCLYLYQWFPNAVVSFNSHVSAAFASGSASVDAFGVRFLGNGDLLEGAQRLAKVLEAAFAQQAGLIVNAEATRPQDGTVKLTLSLPNGFITDGFLNVCVQQGEIVPSVVDVYPLVFTEGDLVTISGQGFGSDTRDLRVGLRDTAGARFFPMDVLRATDTQILARMGPAAPDFTQGPLEVRRGEGYRFAPADPSREGLHEVWWDGVGVAAAPNVEHSFTPLFHCYYSENNTEVWGPLQPNPEPVLVLVNVTWPLWAEVKINAVLVSYLRGIPDQTVQTTFHLPNGGTPLQCAQRIADALADALSPYCSLNMQITEGTNTVVLRPYVNCVFGQAIGSFSVCVRSAGSVELAAVTNTTGGLTIIRGRGFGKEAEDLSVAMLDGGGARLIPLNVIAASDTEITARMGAVPPDARPGPPVVNRGKGSFNSPQPFFEAVDIGPPVFTWLQSYGTCAPPSELIVPLPTIQPEPGRQWFFSDPPNNGELCVVLNGDWPSGAVMSIGAGIHDANGAAYELRVPTVRFAQAGNPVDCAERIADVIRSGFWQQAALAVDAKVTSLPGGAVKLSLSLCNGLIARGFVTVGVTEPPVITTVQTLRGGPGDVVTLSGRGFGTRPEDLLVYVEGKNGVPTLLPVLSATETQIVAVVGIVRPDAQGGQIVIARGEGSQFQKAVPGITGLGLQQWFPAGEVFTRSSETFDPLQPTPTFNTAYFYSVETNGVVCVEVEGDWPRNVRVVVTHSFSSTPPDPSAPPGIYSTTVSGWIDLPGGSAQGCAQAICAVFNGGTSHLSVGVLHCAVTQTGPNRVKLTFFGDVPIYGVFNICYNKPIPFAGLSVSAAGPRAQLSIVGAGHLRVSNLGSSGQDGLRWDLGESQGVLWDFRVPATLPAGARLVLEASGLAAGPSVLIQRTTLEWLGADLRITPDPSPAGATRYQRKLFRNGMLVHQQAGLSGVAALIRGPTGIIQSSCFLGPIGCSLQFEGPLAMALGGGIVVQADTIQVLYEDAQVEPEDLSSLIILGANLPEFTIEGISLLSVLRIRLVNGNTEVSWNDDGTLEEASDPAGPWQEVQPPPTSNLHVEPALAQAKFYRLRKP